MKQVKISIADGDPILSWRDHEICDYLEYFKYIDRPLCGLGNWTYKKVSPSELIGVIV